MKPWHLNAADIRGVRWLLSVEAERISHSQIIKKVLQGLSVFMLQFIVFYNIMFHTISSQCLLPVVKTHSHIAATLQSQMWQFGGFCDSTVSTDYVWVSQRFRHWCCTLCCSLNVKSISTANSWVPSNCSDLWSDAFRPDCKEHPL